MDLVLLAREEDGKVIDPVQGQSQYFTTFACGLKKTIGNQNWILAHPSGLQPLTLLQLWQGIKREVRQLALILKTVVVVITSPETPVPIGTNRCSPGMPGRQRFPQGTEEEC